MRELRTELETRLEKYRAELTYMKRLKNEESNLDTAYERGHKSGKIDALQNFIQNMEYVLKLTEDKTSEYS